jgi:hypothetical protein
MIGAHPAVVEQDIAGHQVQTAPHLVAFRDWLVEQIGGDTSRHFINATGAGILRGDAIEQVEPGAFLRRLDMRRRIDPGFLLRQHRRSATTDLTAQGRTLLRDLRSASEAPPGPVSDWQRFAPSVSSADIVGALEIAFEPTSESLAPPRGDVHARLARNEEWLGNWVDAVSLVPMVLSAHRYESSMTGARIFRFRTTAARLILCAIQPPSDGGLTEDGKPLRQVWTLADVVPGTYAIYREELHFRATDASDPRWNGRRYAVFVPGTLAELESLPLDEILARGI